MSIISALYAGVTGLAAMGKSMQVIGNNIANLNTVGFKGSRTEFADILSQSISTPAGNKQVGRGVMVQSVQGLFHQGSFESTPVVTDVAINGGGYFVLGSGDQMYFSRAGQFRIDKVGNLVSSLGMNVQGFLYDASGQPMNAMGAINLTGLTAPANPTGSGVPAGTGVLIKMNLDSAAVVKPAAFSAADPGGTSNFTSSVTVYDSLGKSHTIMVYFKKTADNTWEWNALADKAEVAGTPPAADKGVLCAKGTLTFKPDGSLNSQTATMVPDFDFLLGGATQSQAIGFDFTGSTQFASASAVNSLTQDGYAAGSLEAIDISIDGIISGVFTNGHTRPLAQLAIASFPAETSLERVGNSLFQENLESGQAVYGRANTGTNGSIAASTLELSNVDLSTEFVNLITHQRAYQANTKIITAGDEMLETVINLKR